MELYILICFWLQFIGTLINFVLFMGYWIFQGRIFPALAINTILGSFLSSWAGSLLWPNFWLFK